LVGYLTSAKSPVDRVPVREFFRQLAVVLGDGLAAAGGPFDTMDDFEQAAAAIKAEIRKIMTVQFIDCALFGNPAVIAYRLRPVALRP